MLANRIQINPAVTTRILVADVERCRGFTKQPYWDRRDLQHRYIQHPTVLREPRTTILCAKWYDSDELIELAEWDSGGRPRFLRRIWDLFSRADIIVGHNIDNADIPWVKGDLYMPRIGHKHVPNLPPLPPFKTVDTLKVLRPLKSGAPFKSLAAMCEILGIPSKTDVYDPEAMDRALEGSVEDRKRLVAYCSGDVIATQGLYDWERPHIKNHPLLLVDGQDKLMTCNKCGNETIDSPRRYIANVLSYSMRYCPTCRTYRRLSFEPERMSVLRDV